MTTPTDDELLARLRDRAGKLREAYAHAEANRDGWFATMPPEISKEWLGDADMFEAVAALIERHRAEVERLTRENNNLSAGQKHALESCWAAEAALAAERKRVGDIEAALFPPRTQNDDGSWVDYSADANLDSVITEMEMKFVPSDPVCLVTLMRIHEMLIKARAALAGKDARGKHEATGA